MPDRAPSAGPRRPFRARTALVLAGVLVILGLAERGARSVLSRRLPTAGAEWIWAPGGLENSQSLAFYAVRDVELGAPPERALAHVIADEAYILYVNGRRVGSGDYFARAPLDSYRLDGLLRPGWNRVAVELRSKRGAGGLLLAILADGEPLPLVRSDAEWRIFRDVAGVVQGTRPFHDGEPVKVWQSPPTGGWGVPRLAAERATFDAALEVDATRLEPSPIEPRPSVATQGVESDFGQPVSGYLLLRGLATAPRRLRIDVGLEPGRSEPVDILLAEGQNEWSTTEVRTLRYADWPYALEGVALSVIAIQPELEKRDAERAASRRRGVFGVEPP